MPSRRLVTACFQLSFFSKFAETLSEAVDALIVTDWYFSSCIHCEDINCETIFAFPSPALIRQFVAKARADIARAVVIVPFTITSSYQPRLMSAAGLPVAVPSSTLESCNKGFFGNAPGCSRLLIVCPNCARGRFRLQLLARPGPDNTVPGCGQVRDWHRRPRFGHPVVCEYRRRIRHALARRLRFVSIGRSPSPLPAL
jgi:hypothetical protein